MPTPSNQHGLPLPRLDSVQMIRAVAAVLVVLYHLATSALGRPTNGASWLALFAAIGSGGVDLFFVISGFVMTVTCFDRLGQGAEVVPFLKRRVLRIYPLYWACLAAVLALAWLAPQFASRAKHDPLDVMKSIALWPQDDFPTVGVAWTLSYEMFFYLVFAALLAAPKRLFLPALAVWAASVVALFPLYDRPEYLAIRGNLQLPLLASPLVLEFIAGCGIGVAYRRGRMPLPRAALVAGVLALIALGGYFGAIAFDRAAYGMERVAIFGVGSALIVYGVTALERAARLPISRTLCFWGDASYSLYLTHVYVILAFGQLANRIPGARHEGMRTVLLIACLATCAAAAAACHLWLERPLTAWSRRLVGLERRTDTKSMLGFFPGRRIGRKSPTINGEPRA